MNDLNLAREILEKEDLTLAVVKNGECIYRSKKEESILFIRQCMTSRTSLMAHRQPTR